MVDAAAAAGTGLEEAFFFGGFTSHLTDGLREQAAGHSEGKSNAKPEASPRTLTCGKYMYSMFKFATRT
jgi:hypothetical protein